MENILDKLSFEELKELMAKIEAERPNPEKTEIAALAYKYGFEAGYKEAKENK